MECTLVKVTITKESLAAIERQRAESLKILHTTHTEEPRQPEKGIADEARDLA